MANPLPELPHEDHTRQEESHRPEAQGAHKGRPAMRHQICARYKSNRDGGLVFSYEAIGIETAQGATWSAVVKLDGETVGTPGGEIRATAGDDYLCLLRQYVEQAIEHKAGVRA